MLRSLLAVSALSLVVAAPAAAEIRPLPEIQCGIVSCTYPIEQKIEYVRDSAQTCVDNTAAAIENVVAGTPQPTTCAI